MLCYKRKISYGNAETAAAVQGAGFRRKEYDMPFTLSTPIIWGALIVIFLIVEGATAGLTSIWFAIGAAAGLIASLCHAPVWLQALLFAAVSAVTLWLTRPLVKKYINGRTEATNADRVLGMTGYVTEDIDNLTAEGAVHMGGKTWTARSVNGEKIPKGTLVRAEKIEGVKLMVTPVTEAVPAGQ